MGSKRVESFDFIREYRTLRSTETREIIDARNAAFSVLSEHSSEPKCVKDLCRLAFQLPLQISNSLNWFAEPMEHSDNQFSIEVDVVESGLIASLLLKEKMLRGNDLASLAVLTASFGGIRAPIVSDLVGVAATTLARAAEQVGEKGEHDLEYPGQNESAGHIAKAKASLTPEFTSAALSSVADDAHNNGSLFAERVSSALSAERKLRNRLAAEVNMLWWYIGDWAKIIDQSRSAVADQAKGVFFGADLGSFVHALPGPYGATAIIRKSLGSNASKKIRFCDAIDALSDDELNAISSGNSEVRDAFFPVMSAINYRREIGKTQWKAPLEKMAAFSSNFELFQSELGAQAYREQILLNSELAQ